MDIITTIILMVFAILQIILFFKIWGMTDDIRAIKNQYLSNIKEEALKETDTSEFSIGDLVINKEGKQMRIKEIENGKYACYTHGGMNFEGHFDKSEIYKFNR